MYYMARKREYVIHPGQKLRIPSGWFHMVFSEGDCLNVALNFFDEQDQLFSREDKVSSEEPRIEASEIGVDVDLYTYVERDSKLRTIRRHNSENGVFISNLVKHRYPGQMEETQKTLQEFIDEHDPDEYLLQGNTSTKDGYLWVNWGNVHSMLHYDTSDNWLHQIKGRKRVVMFPPDDRRLLYVWNSLPIDMIQDISTA